MKSKIVKLIEQGKKGDIKGLHKCVEFFEVEEVSFL